MPYPKHPEEKKEEKIQEEFRIYYRPINPNNVNNNPDGSARQLQLDRLFSQLISSGNTPEEDPNEPLLSPPPLPNRR